MTNQFFIFDFRTRKLVRDIAAETATDALGRAGFTPLSILETPALVFCQVMSIPRAAYGIHIAYDGIKEVFAVGAHDKIKETVDEIARRFREKNDCPVVEETTTAPSAESGGE